MNLKEFEETQMELARRGLMCPVWARLQVLAIKSTTETKENMEDIDARKHRRAVIMHTRTCNHKHCMNVAKMAEKIFGHGTIEKFIQSGEAEINKQEQERLK